MALKVKDIQSWVGASSFAKGQDYDASGAVFDVVCQGGATLLARCHGSRGAVYEQRIVLDGGAVNEAFCSCPVGNGGRCKHVAAVLLTWLDDPDAFAREEPVGDRLTKLNEGQLRQALLLLLERDRDLAWVLDVVAVANGGAGGTAVSETVDPTIYRKRVLAALPSESGWRGTAGAARALGDVAGIGEQLLESGQPGRAAAAFIGALEVGIETYEQYEDETQISGELTRCVEGLRGCLTALPAEAPARPAIMDALFAAFEFHCDYNGISIEEGIAGIVAAHATAAERHAMAQRCRLGLAEGDAGEWRRRELGEFIQDLEREVLDDDGFITLCRETGLHGEAVSRLLSLKRHEEAARLAHRLDDYDLLCLADVYRRHRRTGAFAALLAARADKTRDSRIWEWLRLHWEGKGDSARALDMALREFAAQPGMESFELCLRVAAKGGNDIETKLLQWLRDHGHHDLLTEALLNRGRYDEAAVAFAQRKRRSSWGGHYSELGWAERFAPHRPDVAVPLYRAEAERLSLQRGRSAYAALCSVLSKWREACRDDAARQGFDGFLQALTPEAKRLPALRQEMQRAGLSLFGSA